MTPEEFVGNAIKEMVDDNVSVHFIKRKYNSRYAYDFFTCGDKGDKPELAINYFCEDFNYWFPTFIHEFCHYKQWKENPEKWVKMSDCYDKFGDFMVGKLPSLSTKYLRQIQRTELDADKRALKIIKKYGYDDIIDVDKYIKQSNLYIYTYNYMVKYCKFYVPFEHELMDLMPVKQYTLADCKKPNKQLEQLYYKYLTSTK